MKETITFKEKNVYGVIRIYPACEKAEVLAKLICKKTFDKYQLDQVRQLGFEVNLITLN
jgi:hypothetical protein